MKRFHILKTNKLLLLLILFSILLDQVTKLLARLYLRGGPQNDWVIIQRAFRFTYIENPGMAFGIRIGNELFFTFFATLASFALLWIFFHLESHRNYQYAVGLILGGAVGNLIDRFIYGKVIDFIYLECVNWPVFNVADIVVTIGMIFGIAQLFTSFGEPEEPVPDEHDIWIDDEKLPSDKVIQ